VADYGGRVLSDMQINEFAERGQIVVSQVVPGDILDKAARRIDDFATADPPAVDKRGAHFYFLETKDEPALIAPLTSSPAFGLAEDLADRGTLEIPCATFAEPVAIGERIQNGGAAPADRQAGDPSFRTPLMMTPDVTGDRLW
jgi:hypothetical protein